MLQIDHFYEFLYQEIFKDFEVWHITNGIPKLDNINIHDISIFTRKQMSDRKIFLFDQEPVIENLLQPYLDFYLKHPISSTLSTSERSQVVNDICNRYNFQSLYYFFHGFAALDWYRGYYALNYNKTVIKSYKYDFISFNRIINNDRSYRIYFVSLLKELKLLEKGLVSFNVTDNLFDDWRDETADFNSKLSDKARLHAEQHLVGIDKLIIDQPSIHGSVSADIPRTIDAYWPNNDGPNFDALWNIVTETVFYYDKLHLTEKIFKPIVSKQPFMLLAAPGNLEYLRSYGFKTFSSIINESYDKIQDNDQRIEAVVKELAWYCNLSADEKTDVIEAIAPIVDYNFHHFYGEFRHIISRELVDNIKILFQQLEQDDKHINYKSIYHVLTN